MRIMKLPNGYGSVHKLSGNRWRARKTTGWSLDKKTMKYKQEYTTLGYYPTKKEALQALAAYNEQPYDLDNNLLNSASLLSTMRELILGNITPVKAVNMPIKILYNFVAVV